MSEAATADALPPHAASSHTQRSGTLYMIPATLADPKGAADASLIEWSLPAQVRARAASLTAFAVENAKAARSFLKAIGIARPLQELDITEIGHAPDEKALKPLVDNLLRGIDLGVLSESGCPGIADPGAQLARMAHAAGVRVVPLTGPSSITLALMASGLEGQRFAFAGYAPVKSPQREETIRRLEARSARERETQILIETPYRNLSLFAALTATLKGNTLLSVASGLTTTEEWIATRSVAEWRRAPPSQDELDKLPSVFLWLAAG